MNSQKTIDEYKRAQHILANFETDSGELEMAIELVSNMILFPVIDNEVAAHY